MPVTRTLSLLAVLLLAGLTGCQAASNGFGKMYGCDGSGAGIIIRWGPSTRQGLVEAGYKGLMEPYRWQTGGGFAVDHLSSVDYKRRVAKGLADQVAQHRRAYPNDPVYLAGLSAGCAVVLYALEELPPEVSVDQVILLSPSVSADFDLNPALKHVRGRIYAFTSERDLVLKELAANSVSADGRKVGQDLAGVRGFHLPGQSPAELAYGGKVRNISWRPEFARYGHNGGHTDVVATPFVRQFVAPLVVPAETRPKAPTAAKNTAAS